MLFGASTDAGLRRAGRLGDGFVGFALAKNLDTDAIARTVAVVREAARRRGREALRIVYRIAGRAGEVSAVVPALADAGVTDVVVSVGWTDPGSAARAADRLRSSA